MVKEAWLVTRKYQCPPEGQHTPLQELPDTEVIKQNCHDRTVAICDKDKDKID